MFSAAYANQDWSSRAVTRNADYRTGQRSFQMPNTQDWASVAAASIRERGAKDRALIQAGNNTVNMGLQQQGQMGSQALASQGQIASQGINAKASIKNTNTEAKALLEAERMKRQISPKDVLRMAAGGYVMTKAFDAMKQKNGLNDEILASLIKDSSTGTGDVTQSPGQSGIDPKIFTPQIIHPTPIERPTPPAWVNQGPQIKPYSPPAQE